MIVTKLYLDPALYLTPWSKSEKGTSVRSNDRGVVCCSISRARRVSDSTDACESKKRLADNN